MSAVYLRGHGSFHLLDNEISGSEGRSLSPGWWEYGDAVSVSTGFNSTIGPWDEATQTGLLLENNILSDSSGAGLFLNGASATLVGNTWSGNSTDIWQQACSGVSTPEGLEEEDLATTEFCPTWDRMTLDLILQEKLIEPDIEE
jgi:hypothetical protein